MIKVINTVTLDGQTKEEYDSIVQYLAKTNPEAEGWKLTKEPLINRVTAIKVYELSSMPSVVG